MSARHTSDRLAIETLAAENGWKIRPAAYFGWWSLYLTRGSERIDVRILARKSGVGSQLTQFRHVDGSGVIFAPKRNKFRELQTILEAK